MPLRSLLVILEEMGVPARRINSGAGACLGSERHFMDRMLRVPHEPDEDLRTVEHPVLALATSVSAPECTMGVFEIE